MCGKTLALSLTWIGHRFFIDPFYVMNSFAFRFSVLACFGTMLCLPAVLLESVQAQERTRNIFERRPVRSPVQQPEIPPERSEEISQIAESFRRGLSQEPREQGRTLFAFAIFLGVVAVFVAAFVACRIWQQQRLEKQMNDPVFLVKELNFAHQLSEQEKRLMREISEKNLLSTPLKLFVEPQFLLDAWENEAFAASQPAVQQLLSKLFDISKTSDISKA